MNISKNFKRYGSMIIMILANLFIFFALFLALIRYNNNYNSSIGQKNLEDVKHIVNSTTLTAECYINSKNDKIQDIKHYCSTHTLSTQELLEFIHDSLSSQTQTIQLIDETGKGWQILNSSVEPFVQVSYSMTDINLRNLFISKAISPSTYIQYTPEFQNPYDKKKSIALYTKLYVTDDGTNKVYTLLNLIDIKNLYETLNFQTAREGLSIILCDSYGNFIIRDEKFDNNNFFTFITKHNHLSEISRYDLHTKVYSTKQGLLFYKDKSGEDTMFCYTSLDGKGWFVIGSIAVTAFEERIDVTRLAISVAVLLIIVLVGDFIWMAIIKRRLEISMATQQQQTEIIEAALQEAQSANMAKTVFLNNISHDIRTPINAVIAFSTMAQSTIDDKWATKDYLDKILAGSKHLLGIINSVLDMSQLENGKISITSTEINIMTLLDNIFKMLQPSLKSKKLNFQMETSELKHIDVICDKHKIEQVLLNILSNAIKFTQNGGIVTLIAAETKSHKKGYASYEFTVKDRGVGISPEFMPHLFEPFEKERHMEAPISEGTGLGMAITKSYVEMMDGSISVVSKKNNGTTVTVRVQFKINQLADSNS